MIKFFSGRKAELTMQAMLYIMMSLMMVAIIVFGFKKLVFVGDVINDQEIRDLKNDLQKALDACEDPLNRGNIEHFKIDSNLFDGVCILGDQPLTSPPFGPNLVAEMSIFAEAGDNVVLLEANTQLGGDGRYTYDDERFQILHSFYSDFGGLDRSICNWGPTFEIQCS